MKLKYGGLPPTQREKEEVQFTLKESYRHIRGLRRQGGNGSLGRRQKAMNILLQTPRSSNCPHPGPETASLTELLLLLSREESMQILGFNFEKGTQ